ncbi:hypothetical protein QBC44DRAFT_386509 [Cladorrhinum sp. PSN332]|nr:hypothetical protein QBC44DRAFT_386509 [Cladorrhinum sp. PSN332]
MAVYLVVTLYADLFASEISDVYWLTVSTIWGTFRLQEARSSVQVEDYDWGFGQILPVFLLFGPVIMTVQAIALPEKVKALADPHEIALNPNGISGEPVVRGNEAPVVGGQRQLQSIVEQETEETPLTSTSSPPNRHTGCSERYSGELAQSDTRNQPAERPSVSGQSSESSGTDPTAPVRPSDPPEPTEHDPSHTEVETTLEAMSRDKRHMSAAFLLATSQVLFITVFFLGRSTLKGKVSDFLQAALLQILLVHPLNCILVICVSLVPEMPHARSIFPLLGERSWSVPISYAAGASLGIVLVIMPVASICPFSPHLSH